MKLQVQTLWLIAGLAMSALVFAGDDVGQTYVTITADQVDDDTDRGVEDSTGFSLAVGRGLNDKFSIEGFIHSASLDADGMGLDQDHLEFGVNGLLVFNREGWFSPYLLGGLSNLQTDYKTIDNEDNLLTGSVGAGVMLSPTERFALRLQYRLRNELGGTEYTDQVYSAGFQFGFGGGPRVSSDSDNDGVSNSLDECPNTATGVIVGANGCELDSDKDGVVDRNDQCPNSKPGARVDATGCEIKLDSDRDGVADDIDQCPRTPAGASVDADGCEVDSDGDSVVDSKDRCPDTKAGVRVDIRGCEIKDVIELPGVNFATNSDELLGGSEQVLRDAAATLQKNNDLIVEIAGHTDSDGAAEYNASLSERRARSVRNFLVENGANGANLTVRGYGEAQPIADNSTVEGKAANRRVELRLLQR